MTATDTKATRKTSRAKGANGRDRQTSADPTRARVRAATWWTDKREGAFLQLTEGKGMREVAAGLGIGERTLYTWREDPRWQRRLVELRDRREERFAEAMLGIDQAAMDSMKAHVAKDPHAALEWLHRRGIVQKPAEKVGMTPEFEKQIGEIREGVTGDEIAATIRAVAKYAETET